MQILRKVSKSRIVVFSKAIGGFEIGVLTENDMIFVLDEVSTNALSKVLTKFGFGYIFNTLILTTIIS